MYKPNNSQTTEHDDKRKGKNFDIQNELTILLNNQRITTQLQCIRTAPL